jgi:hypothetical protein
MPSALACATALIVAIPVASVGAPRHHPAAHKAAPPNDVAAWLAKCQTSETECAIGVAEARFDHPVSQAMFHDPDYCVSANDDDLHVLAPKVVAWFKEHPGHGSDPEYSGINAALAAMYPCS